MLKSCIFTTNGLQAIYFRLNFFINVFLHITKMMFENGTQTKFMFEKKIANFKTAHYETAPRGTRFRFLFFLYRVCKTQMPQEMVLFE